MAAGWINAIDIFALVAIVLVRSDLIYDNVCVEYALNDSADRVSSLGLHIETDATV